MTAPAPKAVDLRTAMGWLEQIQPDESMGNRIFFALQALELVACTCPWPADAVSTRHLMGCPAGMILDKALGVAMVDRMHAARLR